MSQIVLNPKTSLLLSKGKKNMQKKILLVLLLKEIRLWPELSCFPRFSIQGGGWSERDRGQTQDGQKFLYYLILDNNPLTGELVNFPLQQMVPVFCVGIQFLADKQFMGETYLPYFRW